MATERLTQELINRACASAMKAHNTCSDKPYLVDRLKASSQVIFAFPGSWSVSDWFLRHPFGETKVPASHFPSLRTIGNDEPASVNEAFLRTFHNTSSQLQNEVEKVLKEKKQVIFAGHSSGGAVAVLATVWFLHNFPKPAEPLCVTFGAPLAGDRIFGHALRREGWSRHFVNMVTTYDIVPRLPFAPLSSTCHLLQHLLPELDPKSKPLHRETVFNSPAAQDLYMEVMRNASAVATRAACKLMGSTNLMLETLNSFTDLSPYRPFGTYVFCCGTGKKTVVINNPDATLQLLFYTAQLTSIAQLPQVANNSLRAHFSYEEQLQIHNLVYLDKLEDLPLSSDATTETIIHMALNDLGLSTKGRLCLRAAGALHNRKMKTQEDANSRKKKIEESLKALESYRAMRDDGNLGYYDAFRLSKQKEDFHANVQRLKLAGIWDEILEMLKRDELPDEFEARKEWIALGTRYRRLVEPLDVANYYRHLKNEDTGPYQLKGRPKRYRYTQRWLEHADNLPTGSSWESFFWAEVEELCIITDNHQSFQHVRDRVLKLEEALNTWIHHNKIAKDVFSKNSTFVKWWNTLPLSHQQFSSIANLITRYQSS